MYTWIDRETHFDDRYWWLPVEAQRWRACHNALRRFPTAALRPGEGTLRSALEWAMRRTVAIFLGSNSIQFTVSLNVCMVYMCIYIYMYMYICIYMYIYIYICIFPYECNWLLNTIYEYKCVFIYILHLYVYKVIDPIIPMIIHLPNCIPIIIYLHSFTNVLTNKS